MPETMTMPVVFFGHGSPTIARETNDTTRTWRAIAESLPRPKSILAISAHWLTRGVAVTAMARPRTIHDFGASLGADLFEIQYPAPGDPALAARVAALLAPAADVVLDEREWGLDHGTWSVLMKAYPDADIPVVQLSLDATKPPSWHAEIGRMLKPLRNEGVLIAATGNIVHNLQTMNWDTSAEPYDWAVRFNDHIKAAIAADNVVKLVNYQTRGRDAELSAPTPDHFWPLLYAAGAAEGDARRDFNPDFILYKSIGMTSVTFAP